MTSLLRSAALIACLGQVSLGWSKPAMDCSELTDLLLKDARVVQAETVDGPEFIPPAAPHAPDFAQPKPLTALPSFCRVSGVISPAIRFEVWLPLRDWNGKFQGTGNGGYNGSIVYPPLAAGVRRGYATSSTDMGHAATTPDPGSWALGRPDLVADQGYRAQHETALKAKQIIRAFYGSDPRRSYFTGCSSGGWQGLTEAQRFPQDYDGILAGAPAINVVQLHAATLSTVHAMKDIAPEKYRLVTDAILATCDAADGVRDGLLENPMRCEFAPQELACRSGQQPELCLTPAEVSAFQKIYDGPKYSSGASVAPGWPIGLEYALETLPRDMIRALAASTFKNMVYEDPKWDDTTIDFDRDVPYANRKIGHIVNSYDPDLSEFRKSGGKLILYHGWDDALISALNTLNYFQQVAATLSDPKAEGPAAFASIGDFARLFLMPGYSHCSGGPGPNEFDGLAALERWVEQGIAPDQIIASHRTDGAVNRTRPLCPYPQVAEYQRQGSTDVAANFSCRKSD